MGVRRFRDAFRPGGQNRWRRVRTLLGPPVALGAYLVLRVTVLCAGYPASLNPAALSQGSTPLRVAEDLCGSLGLGLHGVHSGALGWFTIRLRLVRFTNSPFHPDRRAHLDAAVVISTIAKRAGKGTNPPSLALDGVKRVKTRDPRIKPRASVDVKAIEPLVPVAKHRTRVAAD